MKNYFIESFCNFLNNEFENESDLHCKIKIGGISQRYFSESPTLYLLFHPTETSGL